MSTFRYSKVRDVKSPTRGTPGSAGIDFYLPENIGDIATGNNCFVIGENAILIGQGGDVLIPSGIKAALPPGYCLTLNFGKSGVVSKKRLIQCGCLIDEDYQGEFSFHLINAGIESTIIMGGEKIAQGIVMLSHADWPLQEVENPDDLHKGIVTIRGEGGFGSTGVN